MPIATSALLTDLYQFTMLQAYHAEGMNEPAVFELFSRRLPRSGVFCWPLVWSRRSIFWRTCDLPPPSWTG